jgi:hypothetical protein
VVIRVHCGPCCVIAEHWTEGHVPEELPEPDPEEGCVLSFSQLAKKLALMKSVKSRFFIVCFFCKDTCLHRPQSLLAAAFGNPDVPTGSRAPSAGN